MKEIRIEPGSIYMLRVSIPEAFGIFEINKPETSSFASCASSSSTKSPTESFASTTKRKKNRYFKRPCIVLFNHPRSITVLPITRFHGHDPTSTDTNTTIVLPELTRDDLFKYLLSIYPNPPVSGRNSIKIKSNCPSTYFTPKNKHYLILKPTSISSDTIWPNPIPDFVELHELHYITQIIFELSVDERQSRTGIAQLQLIVKNPENKTASDEEDDDEDDKTTSSSSSSFPIPRFERYLLLQNDLNQSWRVQQWLNNLESSCNSAAEDTIEGLSIDFIIKSYFS